MQTEPRFGVRTVGYRYRSRGTLAGPVRYLQRSIDAGALKRLAGRQAGEDLFE
jgi:hypothetical protein